MLTDKINSVKKCNNQTKTEHFGGKLNKSYKQKARHFSWRGYREFFVCEFKLGFLGFFLIALQRCLSLVRQGKCLKGLSADR